MHNGNEQLGQYSERFSVNHGESANTSNNAEQDNTWPQGLVAAKSGPYQSIYGVAQNQQILVEQTPAQQTPYQFVYAPAQASSAARPANQSSDHQRQVNQVAIPQSQYLPNPTSLSGNASGLRAPNIQPASFTQWDQEKLQMVGADASCDRSQEAVDNSDIQGITHHYRERAALGSGVKLLWQNQVPTTTFKDFPKFPLEIRNAIWKLAWDAVPPVGDRHIHFSTLPNGNGGVQQNSWFSINRRPEPDFLSFRNICSESRRVCSKSFPDYGKDIVDWMGLRFPLYINFSKDTLVFDAGKGIDHLMAIGQGMGRENCLKVKSICKITGSPLMHFWMGTDPQDPKAEKTLPWHTPDQLAMVFKTFPCLDTIKLLPSVNKTLSNDDRKLLRRFKYDGRGFCLEEYQGPFLQHEYRWAVRHYSNAWQCYLGSGDREAIPNITPRCPRIVMVSIRHSQL